jgi:hypothetical protein
MSGYCWEPVGLLKARRCGKAKGMATRFVNFDRNTPMLLPPDLRDWIGEYNLVHFVIAPLQPGAMSGDGATGGR